MMHSIPTFQAIFNILALIAALKQDKLCTTDTGRSIMSVEQSSECLSWRMRLAEIEEQGLKACGPECTSVRAITGNFNPHDGYWLLVTLEKKPGQKMAMSHRIQVQVHGTPRFLYFTTDYVHSRPDWLHHRMHAWLNGRVYE